MTPSRLDEQAKRTAMDFLNAIEPRWYLGTVGKLIEVDISNGDCMLLKMEKWINLSGVWGL